MTNDTSFNDTFPTPTSSNSEFIFYDIESLGNIYTVAAYDTLRHHISIFFLLDDIVHADGSRTTGADVMAIKDHITAAVLKANPAAFSVYRHNPNPGQPVTPTVSLHNLDDTDPRQTLILTQVLGGVCFDENPHMHNPENPDDGVRLISGPHTDLKVQTRCDTDPAYQPDVSEPFIVGYNSMNYDTTMLALFYATRFSKTWERIGSPNVADDLARTNQGPLLSSASAAELRRHNDQLFSEEHKKRMPNYLRSDDSDGDLVCAQQLRANMINSGRHVDLARLNELQSLVGLKRLLGQMGHQILESDRLSGPDAVVESLNDVVDLLAYNVSDVLGTWLLFGDPTYSGSFDLRSGLLRTYPETVFRPDGQNNYATPGIRRNNVDKWRLGVDTSSAQFAAKILSPYRHIWKIPGHNGDLPVVSLRYPDAQVAADTGREQVNVLTEARNFLLDNLDGTGATEALDNFRQIYQYYRTIEGMNFNEQNTVFVEIVRSLRKTLHALAGTDDTIAQLAEEYTQIFTPKLDNHAAHGQGQFTPVTFTLPVLKDLMSRIRAAVCDSTNPTNNQSAINTVAKNTAYLEMYYQAKFDSQIPFDRDQDPNPDMHLMTWPPQNTGTPLLHEGLASVAKAPGNIPYVDAQGNPTGCFAAFSTGGIHGAEYNAKLYAAENASYDRAARWLDHVIATAYTRYTELCQQAADPEVKLTKKDAAIPTGAAAWAETVSAIRDTDLGENSEDTVADLARAVWLVYKTGKITAGDTERTADDLLTGLWLNRGTDSTDISWMLEAGESALKRNTTNAVRNGAEQFASVVAEIRKAGPRAGLTVTQTAEAAWTLRKQIRIDVPVTEDTPPELLESDAYDPTTGMITVENTDVLLAKSKADTPFWRSEPKGLRHTELFQNKRTTKQPEFPAGATHQENKLNQRYVYTSVDDVIHEDFTSYYPLMLSNMAAFTNPDLADGEQTRDRYREIFDQKEAYGRQMKTPGISPEDKAAIGILREGTKLILNSASGAADASFPTRILMNNRIIAMRMIGQLFSWRVGQAQSFAGARIVSTNTDGLYSTLDSETNNRILAEQTAAIGVDIEPEELTLVSKDSNNRVEFTTAEPGKAPWDREVIAASGGTLACASGPSPRKALNHPAISDYALVEYFKYIVGDFVPDEHGFIAEPGDEGLPLSMDRAMNRDLVRTAILPALHRDKTPGELLTFYQNLVASSPNMNTYLYTVPYTVDQAGNPDGTNNVISASDPERITFPGDNRPGADQRLEVTLLQHYSRVFLVEPERATANGLTDLVTLAAVKTKAITEASAKARRRQKRKPIQQDPTARYLLQQAGTDLNAGNAMGKDLVVTKHTGVSTTAPLVVVNDTLLHNPDDDFLNRLIDSLDTEAYIDMIVNSYDSSWRNTMPETTA